MQNICISKNNKLQIAKCIKELKELNVISTEEKNILIKWVKDNDSNNINLFANRLIKATKPCFHSIISNLYIK